MPRDLMLAPNGATTAVGVGAIVASILLTVAVIVYLRKRPK
ncbi:hypothetical protein SAMN06298212_11146 [Ruaniaceae bacterium KH17]|nr:hypothetical protein SAMN06298212_11146 [Ruaniaceae bacterium KH17]